MMIKMTSWAENSMSKQDIMSMQQHAVQRVAEMQRQARKHLQNTQTSFEPAAQPHQAANSFSQNERNQPQNNQASNYIDPNQNADGYENVSTNYSSGNSQQPFHQNEHNGQNGYAQQNEHDRQGETASLNQGFNQNNAHFNTTPPSNGAKSPFSFLSGLGKSGLSGLSGLASSGLSGLSGGGLTDMFQNLIPKSGEDSPISKVMDTLHLDSERLMIIALMVLLLNDGADYTLILALGYILL